VAVVQYTQTLHRTHKQYIEHKNTLGTSRVKHYTLVYPELFCSSNKNHLASCN